MNKAVLLGRLGKDPEIRWTNSNPSYCVATYTLAVRSKRKNQDGTYKTEWINCRAIGKSAEFAEKYMKKGGLFCVAGAICTDSYEKDGKKYYPWYVQVEEQDFCESKKETQETQETQADGAPQGFMNIPNEIDEELPFV